MKNRYVHRARISEEAFKEICHFFSIDTKAADTALSCEVSRPTINKIYNALRLSIMLSFQPSLVHHNGSPLVFGIKVEEEKKIDIIPLHGFSVAQFYTALQTKNVDSQWHNYCAFFDTSLQKLLVVNSDYEKKVRKLWNFMRLRLIKLRGIHKHKILLHLYESLFRFYYRKNDNMEQTLLSMCAARPLKLSEKK